MTTFRRHIADLLIITLVLFAGLVTLATLLPFTFHGAADPYSTPKGTRPPWYMLAPYALFQLPWIPGWVFGLALLVVAACVPFLPALLRLAGDRIDEARLKRIGLGVLGLWALLSIAGIFVDRR